MKMKSLFKLFWKGALVLALIPGALWSCEEIDNPEDLLDQVSFKLDPPEVTIPAEGGTAAFSLNAPVAWKAVAKDNWVSADPANGDAGKVTVTLRADANTTGTSRSTDVTVSATGFNASATVKVTQPAKEENPPAPTPEIKLDKANATVPAAGATVTVKVTSNVEWTAAADCDWLSLRPANGAAGDTDVTVVAAANTEEKQKTGKITFTAGEKTAVLEVTIEAYVPEAPKAMAVITIIYPSTWTGIKLYLEGADGEKPCGEKYGMDPTQVSEETHDMFGATWKAAAFEVTGNFTQPQEYTMIVSDASSIVAPEYNVTLEDKGQYGFFVTPDAVIDVNDIDPETDPGNDKPKAYINVNYPAEWTGIRLYLESADGEKPCGAMPGAEPLYVSDTWTENGTSMKTASFVVSGEFSEGKVYKMLVFDMGAGVSAPEKEITLRPDAKFNIFVTHDSTEIAQTGNKATIMIAYPSNWSTAKLYLEAADGEKPCGNMPGMDPTYAVDEAVEYAGGTWKVAFFEFYGEFYTDDGGKEYTMTVSDGRGNVAPAYELTLLPNSVFQFLVTSEKVEIFNEDPEDPEDPEEPDPDMPGDIDAEGGVVLFEGEYSESENSGVINGLYMTARANKGDIIRIKYTLNNWEQYKYTADMAAYLEGTGITMNIGDPFGIMFFNVGRGEAHTGQVACTAPMLKQWSGEEYDCLVADSGTIALKMNSRDVEALRSWDNSFCICGVNVTITKVVLFHKDQ